MQYPNKPSPRLLIAASGTGGHVFPAIATAEQLSDFDIEWLGVPDRLETQLVGDRYPLHTVAVRGFQTKGWGALKTLWMIVSAVWKVRKILQRGKFDAIFTTGGYIAAPTIVAARSLSIPVVFHEANALPGKVARMFAPWCNTVAIGFEDAAARFPGAKTIFVGTPVRSQFREALQARSFLELPIPDGVPLIVIVGGSQGAVALNQLVREAAPTWFEAGAWVVHLTGENDPDAKSLEHPQYLALPFYNQMAPLFQRANLVIGRAGAGTLTELAVTHTPAILIPYPFAAEDHQAFNAMVFVKAGAAEMIRQSELTSDLLKETVLGLLKSPDRLHLMSEQAKSLAVLDSAERTAQLVRQCVESKHLYSNPI